MSVSLAEPRRKQKWTLNPRGNLWANDDQKIGQKLMEKMGWEKGNGLGANQDGRTEHIKVKLKDNQKGVGFEGQDDTWIAHQEDFQAVLAALNVEHGDENKHLTETEKKSSLEAISRKSKRRVHYQKFVKGKDLNNYSADDMSCILGTKSAKSKAESQNNSGTATPEREVKVEENPEKFVQKGNYQEYFAQKMAALKAQGKFTSVPAWQDASLNTTGDSKTAGLGLVTKDVTETQMKEQTSDSEIPKKKKKSVKKESDVENDDHEFVVNQDPAETNNLEDASHIEKQKKKKKKSKDKRESRRESTSPQPEAEEAVAVHENDGESSKKKKKSKKSKRATEEESPNDGSSVGNFDNSSPVQDKPSEDLENEMVIDNNDVTESKQKKKKCKNEMKKSKKPDVDDADLLKNDSECEEEAKPKKKKKGKKEKVKHIDQEEGSLKRKCENNEDDGTQKKKKKRSGDFLANSIDERDSNNSASPEDSGENIETVGDKPKKKKKEKKEKSGSEIETPDSVIGFKGSNFLAIPGYGSNELPPLVAG